MAAINELYMNSTRFIGNWSGALGAGLYAAAVAVISGAQFSRNHCDDPGCRGGGLFAGGDLTVIATEFRDNGAAQGGGLWHLPGPGLRANAFFAGNTVSDNAAAVYLSSTGHVQIRDRTIPTPTP